MGYSLILAVAVTVAAPGQPLEANAAIVAQAAVSANQPARLTRSGNAYAKPKREAQQLFPVTEGDTVTVIKPGKWWAWVKNAKGEEGYVPISWLAAVQQTAPAPATGSAAAVPATPATAAATVTPAPTPAAPPPAEPEVKSSTTADTTLTFEPTPAGAIPVVKQSGSAGAAEKGIVSAAPGEIQVEPAGPAAYIRMLADKLVAALQNLPGQGRYMNIAVLEFGATGEAAEKDLGRFTSYQLQTFLVKDHNLTLVERAKLASILKEQALGQTGVVAENEAIQVGELLAAQALVVGTVQLVGANYEVNARLVSTKTGKTLVADSVSIPAEGLVALSAESVLLKSKGGAFMRSLLVPGWGQLYSNHTLMGVSFIAVEGGLLAGSLTFHLLGRSAKSDYENAGPNDDAEALRTKGEDRFAIRNLLFYSFMGVHVLDAFLAYATGPAGEGFAANDVFNQSPSASNRAFALAPLPLEQGGGLVFAGHF